MEWSKRGFLLLLCILRFCLGLELPECIHVLSGLNINKIKGLYRKNRAGWFAGGTDGDTVWMRENENISKAEAVASSGHGQETREQILRKPTELTKMC